MRGEAVDGPSLRTGVAEHLSVCAILSARGIGKVAEDTGCSIKARWFEKVDEIGRVFVPIIVPVPSSVLPR